MRKILFRAKPYFGDNKWIYGGVIVREVVQQYGKFECAFHPMYVISRNDDYLWCPVDPETVGQFIGLKDKNDKMIFEGDVIKWRKHIFVVEFYTDDFLSVFYPFCWTEDSNIKASECEIIGNIYDDPELKEKCKRMT